MTFFHLEGLSTLDHASELTDEVLKGGIQALLEDLAGIFLLFSLRPAIFLFQPIVD